VVTARDGGVELVGERLAERAGWMRITALTRSVRLTGWIPRWQLENLDSTIAGGSTCDCPPEGPVFARIYADKPLYEGPARVAAGTVLSAPGGEGEWARVERDVELRVIVSGRSDSVEVTAIPGLGGLGSYGFVDRGAVTVTRR
jgi:hypothetical protein